MIKQKRGIIAYDLHYPTFICRLVHHRLEIDNIVSHDRVKHLLIIVDINIGLSPVTSINLALEENVNLTVRSALHLRNAEICGDKTDETSTAPDVTALATN